ncbi:RelA/SpoT family protein [Candidatus Symbiobacter mobilis]|uniref:GTP pyrophosphokinase n=1 Tax=Candidatus Symbiobacter mobilis CR TaxID=946483 RepID=U5NA92_9BURK|nr:RelA/SpoT family protein [Candidatus Symbiobacter mobilis]AGX88461.1 GTP pyrophosphokinase [Candidatus Symbiobacter mobilis CR]
MDSTKKTCVQPDPGTLPARARAFALPLIEDEALETGEGQLAHADGVARIVAGMGGSPTMQAALYLVYASAYLHPAHERIAKGFGDDLADLVTQTARLVAVQRRAYAVRNPAAQKGGSELDAVQIEHVRKMLLAFSRDVRVVLLRLVSRLQTLRYFAQEKIATPPGLAAESLHVFASLANRLGIWELKWELEDLSFRFLEPETYYRIACLLSERRVDREASVERLRSSIEEGLRGMGIAATVTGRPKHIYSIVKKMRGKSLEFDQVYDVRALRVIVSSIRECYAALGWIHGHFLPLTQEFDDYIARPKANGYQSLHTVIHDMDGRPAEVQIRTQAMHDHAEHGVAAHWAYKEAGTKGYAGVSATGEYEGKIAVLRQLLAWERDLSAQPIADHAGLGDCIYVLTPQAAIVELPQGATPVDFAYGVHTALGHRCRGARVDGVMVPLHTPLGNGQTVEIVAGKEEAPSRDWLNPELGYLVSHRAKTKVRAWFHAVALQETMAKGRDAVTKLLQREGKTALAFEDLAAQLGYDEAQTMLEEVGRGRLPLRRIEILLRPQPAQPELLEVPQTLPSRAARRRSQGGLRVAGVDSLLTQLAKCCKPAPPDDICGFVARGKGVSVHRRDCPNVGEMLRKHGQRWVEVEWDSAPSKESMPTFPVDIFVQAQDRQGLLRDISDVFTRERINVTGVQTRTVKGIAWMTFTLEVGDAVRLHKVLALVEALHGVRCARRR